MSFLGNEIIRAARGWLGTRFHHQGRLKKTVSHGGGVDCLGLLAGIAAELDLRDRSGRPLTLLDETDYGHYPDGEYLRKKLGEVLNEIPKEEMQPGDVLLLKIDGVARHLGIVGENETIIHAYAPARAVVEHAFSEEWWRRVVAVFRVMG